MSKKKSFEDLTLKEIREKYNKEWTAIDVHLSASKEANSNEVKTEVRGTTMSLLMCLGGLMKALRVKGILTQEELVQLVAAVEAYIETIEEPNSNESK